MLTRARLPRLAVFKKAFKNDDDDICDDFLVDLHSLLDVDNRLSSLLDLL